MTRKNTRILVVDESPEIRERTRGILSKESVDVTAVAGPVEALRVSSSFPADVIVTDLDFRGFEPSEFLEAVTTWLPDAVLVAYIGKGRSVDARRFFEVLEKPVDDASLQAAVMRAVEFEREIRETRDLEKLNRERFQTRLDWLLWKRTRDTRRQIDYALNLVKNMRHAISQGEGVGSLVTQTEMLEILAEDSNGSRIMPADLAASMTTNARAVRAWLDSLERFSAIEEARYDPESLSASAVHASIVRAVEAVERFRSVNGHRVIVNPVRFAGEVITNTQALELTLRELLTNAFKYSPPASEVSIVELRAGASISIGVINDAGPGSGRIALETEAFVPFARTSNVYQDRFIDEELSLGIGLPVVQDAMQQTGASVFLREIKDHTQGAIQPRVLAEIVFAPRALTSSGSVPVRKPMANTAD